MSHKESQKLFNSLTGVRDDFIYEAQEDFMLRNNVTHRKKRKILPIVACLVLLLFSVTLFASTDWGTYLIDKFTSRTEIGSDYIESGYDIKVNIEKKPIKLYPDSI